MCNCIYSNWECGVLVAWGLGTEHLNDPLIGAPHSSVGSARATHVPRLCSGPGFDSRPGSLCCVSLPLSYPVSCLSLHLYY